MTPKVIKGKPVVVGVNHIDRGAVIDGIDRCNYIVYDWFTLSGISLDSIAPGDKLRIRIEVIKEGRK